MPMSQQGSDTGAGPPASPAPARPAVLLVSRREAVDTSLETVASLLAFRRDQQLPDDSLLGVWVRPQLDEGLPRRLCTGEIDFGPALGHHRASRAPAGDTEAGRGGLALDETLSFAGVWTLAWLESAGPFAHGRRARLRILEELVAPAAGPSPDAETAVFLPVYDNESRQAAEPLTRGLRRSYPALVSGRWFIMDSQRGNLGRSEADNGRFRRGRHGPESGADYGQQE